MSQKIKYISGIKDEFDYVLCGVNGVFMYGNKVDSQSVDVLIKLYQSGKKIALASNSAMRVNDLYHTLKHKGVPMNIFYAAITAGELAHFYLKNNHNLGRSYYNLSDADSLVMRGLEYERVTSPVMADFMLAETDYKNLDDEKIMPILEQALHLGLPMICVGNNTALVSASGVVSGVGAIAEKYAILGGKEVLPFGKPDVRIAAYLTEEFSDFKKERCLIIGDCMPTDVRMADSFGAKSLLITNGVHQMGQNLEQQIADLSGSYGLNVDYYTEVLRW